MAGQISCLDHRSLVTYHNALCKKQIYLKPGDGTELPKVLYLQKIGTGKWCHSLHLLPVWQKPWIVYIFIDKCLFKMTIEKSPEIKLFTVQLQHTIQNSWLLYVSKYSGVVGGMFVKYRGIFLSHQYPEYLKILRALSDRITENQTWLNSLSMLINE